MEILRTYYELEERKYSSNVIVKVNVVLNDKGKEQELKQTFLIPAGKKKEGDKIADFILPILQNYHE